MYQNIPYFGAMSMILFYTINMSHVKSIYTPLLGTENVEMYREENIITRFHCSSKTVLESYNRFTLLSTKQLKLISSLS